MRVRTHTHPSNISYPLSVYLSTYISLYLHLHLYLYIDIYHELGLELSSTKGEVQGCSLSSENKTSLPFPPPLEFSLQRHYL